jgi:hypothetical protein
MRQGIAFAVLLAVAGHVSAEALQWVCRAAIGEDDPVDIIIAVSIWRRRRSPNETSDGRRPTAIRRSTGA